MTSVIERESRVAVHGAGAPRHERRRWRIIAALVVVFVLGAGVAGGVVWWLSRPAQHQSNPAALAANAISAGVTAQGRGDLTTAVADYQQALRYEPRNTQALYDLGVVDYAQGNVGLAEVQYRKVIAINARYEPALYNLAIIDQNRGNTAEALSLYQQAVRAVPSDARAHFNLALMLRAMPRYVADGNAQMKIALQLDRTLRDPAVRH